MEINVEKRSRRGKPKKKWAIVLNRSLRQRWPIPNSWDRGEGETEEGW